jgi:ketosteroid isomerase-like protein
LVGTTSETRHFESREVFLDTVILPLSGYRSTQARPAVRSLFADGDTVIAHFDATVTMPDGTPWTSTNTWYLRIRDGQVDEAIAFMEPVERADALRKVSPGE